MKILVLTKYSEMAASSRMRVFQYLDYLRLNGSAITVAPLLSEEYLRRLYLGRPTLWLQLIASYVARARRLVHAAGAFDLIWFEKEMFPWCPAILERLLANRRIPYVVDYDDAIFHNYDNHRLSAVRYFLGDKIDWVMSHADWVVVGNEYLAGRARQAGAKHITVLPTVVDLTRYSATVLPGKPHFTIGWIGTPITTKYLKIVAPALQQVCARVRAEVVTVGAGQVDLGVPARSMPWHRDTEAGSIAEFDVGIMPLRDGPFERGKCGYKLIQYMAAGRPVVGSPVGVNCRIIRHGVNGFIANSMQEWTDALLKLHHDFGLRQRMGVEARKTVESEYCLQATAPQLISILRRAVDQHKTSADSVRAREPLAEPSCNTELASE
jgi:glycosyltransferase involved in cell wall biosynthesis